MKLKAKDQLLGNYGIAAGSFALLFVLVYSVMMIITSAMAAGSIKTGAPAVDQTTIAGFIEMRVLTLVIGALSGVLSTGYTYMMKKIAEGQKAVPGDLFFVFKNHPDKVIIISVILLAVQTLLLLPASIISFGGFGSGKVTAAGQIDMDGKKFLLWCVLYFAGLAVSFIINLYLSMSYFVYLDDTELGVADIIKESIRLMRGNCFRYFYLLLSFIGYGLLIIMSLGIAALWVVPYETMTLVHFYRDLADNGYEC